MDNPQNLTFRPFAHETWTNFATLFLGRGGPKSCWCMVWRDEPNRAKVATDGASRREAMTRIVAEGKPVGILGYCNEQPVAWCSIAPRGTMKSAMSANFPGDDKLQIWSLACFYVQVE